MRLNTARTTILLSFCILFSFAQTIKLDKDITVGTIDSVRSNILNETRKIWVYVPWSADTATNDQERFPVVYLLDGDAHFFAVQSMIFHMSERARNNLCPKMILVGITNISGESRTRDLSPSKATSDPEMDSSILKVSGGAENFTSFIEKELMPYIEAKYPTAPYKTLIGHSFGGLFTINTLIHHSDLFNSYVAIDPSLYWDNNKLITQSKTILQQNKFNNKTLYLSIANTMDSGTDTIDLKKSNVATQLHVRAQYKFIEYLKTNKNNGLRWEYKYYKDDTHNSVPFITEYDAFRFIFGFYKCSFLKKLADPKFNGDSALFTHYKNISKKMGYAVFPPEPVLNDIGYMLLQQKQYKKAYAFLKANCDNHPKSWNTFDSMGDYYIAVGDKQKAIEYLTKALKLKYKPSTKERLDKLMNSK